MTGLTKFDVLRYVAEFGKTDIDKLITYVRRSVRFEKVSERRINDTLRLLQREGYILKDGKDFSLDATKKTLNTLAFLLWCKKDFVDYNTALHGSTGKLFKRIFEGYCIKNITSASGFSKPTTLKIVRDLEKINFVAVTKRKPLSVKAQITDRTLLFSNIFGLDFRAFQKSLGTLKSEKRTFSKLTRKSGHRLREELIKLHVYSTTVTEGNTATEHDVELVFKNAKTDLSPREVIEIVNAKNAIDAVINKHKTTDISADIIKRLHKIVMANLVESAGDFSYVRKRVIGSETKFPESKLAVDVSVETMINFYNAYKNKINPLILAPLIHFIFVSIHPFIDGNGRIARLLHSLILLKSGLPIFAFNPTHRNGYFSLLEKGRSESLEDFIKFCIEKHKELVENMS